MNKMTEGHTVKRYDGEMTHLHQLVLEIGNLVCDQLDRAVQTLKEEDPNEARAVIERDKQVNQLDVQAEEALITLIAKRQPVAKDLRELITVNRIVTDLERVGDEARKIASLTICFYDNDASRPNPQMTRDIMSMTEFVKQMVRNSVESFDELDLQKAVDVIRVNEDLENEFKSALRTLSTFLIEDGRNIGHVVHVVLGLRALERIGGHAKNIAGYVVFLVKGKDVRHEPLEAVLAEVGPGSAFR